MVSKVSDLHSGVFCRVCFASDFWASCMCRLLPVPVTIRFTFHLARVYASELAGCFQAMAHGKASFT